MQLGNSFYCDRSQSLRYDAFVILWAWRSTPVYDVYNISDLSQLYITSAPLYLALFLSCIRYVNKTGYLYILDISDWPLLLFISLVLHRHWLITYSRFQRYKYSTVFELRNRSGRTTLMVALPDQF